MKWVERDNKKSKNKKFREYDSNNKEYKKENIRNARRKKQEMLDRLVEGS